MDIVEQTIYSTKLYILCHKVFEDLLILLRYNSRTQQWTYSITNSNNNTLNDIKIVSEVKTQKKFIECRIPLTINYKSVCLFIN